MDTNKKQLHILDSADIFVCYAQIDFSYLAIEKIFEKMKIGRKPIEIMIDQASNYNFKKEETKSLIALVEDIIECKQKINANYSYDENFLVKLKKL